MDKEQIKQIIGENQESMVDRLTHKAHLVNMSGQSYRVKETQNMRRYVSQK